VRWRKAVEEALRKGGEEETRIKESEIESLGLEREWEEEGGGSETKTREREHGSDMCSCIESMMGSGMGSREPCSWRMCCATMFWELALFSSAEWGRLSAHSSERKTMEKCCQKQKFSTRRTLVIICAKLLYQSSFVREVSPLSLALSLSLTHTHTNPQGKTPPQSCEADLMWVGL
jgi:hypothetical protein